MELISHGSKAASAVIRTDALDISASYRLSIYSFLYAHKGVYLIKHMLSNEMYRLDESEYLAVKTLEASNADHDFITKHSLNELVKRRFIVELGYDELAKYRQAVEMLKIMQFKAPGIKTYTIFPTTGCNARCVYCYEEGYAVRSMTRDTAKRLIDYICETRQQEKITLVWFGGEPLLSHEIISYVCGELSARSVPFRSKIVTNGSLFTQKLVKEAKAVWALETAQISLDGSREDYTARKKYLLPRQHNYDTVIGAVHMLAEEGINVRLRVNFDKDNLPRMQSFIDEMEAEFGSCDNVSMYLGMLFQQQNADDCIATYEKMFELYRNNRGSRLLKEVGLGTEFKLNHCMADNLDKNIVIDPDGGFSNCEHLPGGDYSWGSIFDGVTDKIKLERLSAPSAIDKSCETCRFLPHCTPFHKCFCPDHFDKCFEYNMIKLEYESSNIAEELLRVERS